MHRDVHPRSFVDLLYITRAQRGRELLSFKDCIELERSDLFDYAENNNKILLKTATEELQLKLMGRIKIDDERIKIGKNKY